MPKNRKANKSQLPQRKLPNLLVDAEQQQYGKLAEKNEEIQLYMRDIIRKMITSLEYPVSHKFMHITFTATFTPGRTEVALSNIYYTSEKETDDNAQAHTIKNGPELRVTEDDMTYMQTRIAETDKSIWNGFIKNRLGCSRANMFKDENPDATSYVFDIIYILGAQKHKPLGNIYRRPT